MPPMMVTRSEALRKLAGFAAAVVLAPVEGLLGAARKAFEPAPRVRRPQESVRRNG